MSPHRGQECWLLLPGSLVGGGTQMSVGRPKVSHSVKDPVTCTVVVSSLSATGSWEAPVEETIALGAGLAAGMEVVVIR